MQTYAALLRAVNLGSRNKVSMAALRELVEELGGVDVTTYVQSGNVVFRSPERSAAKVERGLEKRISADFGLDVKVLVRTGRELAKIVAGNPFDEAPDDVHVAFLGEKPSAARVRELDPEFGLPDEFHVAGREVYARYPKGYGRTKINNAWFEKQLGVAATTRNWRTVTKLAELAG